MHLCYRLAEPKSVLPHPRSAGCREWGQGHRLGRVRHLWFSYIFLLASHFPGFFGKDHIKANCNLDNILWENDGYHTVKKKPTLQNFLCALNNTILLHYKFTLCLHWKYNFWKLYINTVHHWGASFKKYNFVGQNCYAVLHWMTCTKQHNTVAP